MKESKNVLLVQDLIMDKILRKHETNKKTERNSRKIKGRKQLPRQRLRSDSKKGDNKSDRKKGKLRVYKKGASKSPRKSKHAR